MAPACPAPRSKTSKPPRRRKWVEEVEEEEEFVVNERPKPLLGPAEPHFIFLLVYYVYDEPSRSILLCYIQKVGLLLKER
jgi:hypothetical protein